MAPPLAPRHKDLDPPCAPQLEYPVRALVRAVEGGAVAPRQASSVRHGRASLRPRLPPVPDGGPVMLLGVRPRAEELAAMDDTEVYTDNDFQRFLRKRFDAKNPKAKPTMAEQPPDRSHPPGRPDYTWGKPGMDR